MNELELRARLSAPAAPAPPVRGTVVVADPPAMGAPLASDDGVELADAPLVPAAVLVSFLQGREGGVLLTKRTAHLNKHAGQVSFPGGRIDPEDASPEDAALREAREEIGLDARFVSVVGYLPDHVIISGFRVTPVVGFVQPGFELLLDATEVQDTFEVPLDFVFDPANHRIRLRRFGYGQMEVEVCDIPYGDRNIWGATAGMLLTLYRLVLEGN